MSEPVRIAMAMMRKRTVALILLVTYLVTPALLQGLSAQQDSAVDRPLCRCCINHQSCCCLQCKEHHGISSAEGICSCEDDDEEIVSPEPAATESFAKATPVLLPLYAVSPADYQSVTGFTEPSEKPPPA